MLRVAILSLFLIETYAFNPYKKIISKQVHGNFGDPVFLTKYIDKNDTDGARRASAVRPLSKNIESYSGFFTVNKEYNSNIYFWFFPAERHKEHAPVVVWLQGGPGASSLFGLFTENGPFYIDKIGRLRVRNLYWPQIANVVYIDNPVGTGFSFTQNSKGYVTDEVQVGMDLYEAIDQFFLVFAEYRKNDFYIFGESYGGKYAPAMAYTIHKNNFICDRKINLKGIGIGNGFTDPVNMMNYGEYLNQLGLIDEIGKNEFQKLEKKIIQLTNKGEYLAAGKLVNDLTDGKRSLFFNTTGFTFQFNYIHSKDYLPGGDLGKFLEGEEVRRSIHVGNLSFVDSNEIVIEKLSSDMMKSVKPWLQVLLDNYNVLVYNGQLDIICAYPLTVNYLKKLKWSGAEEYKSAVRKKWYVGKELAGYVKNVKGLTEVMVRNAGHMVPTDQPTWAITLFEKFIFNLPF